MRKAGEIFREEKEQIEEDLPNTKGVKYPQDSQPAGSFGNGVGPTELPMLRDRYMRSPEGGIAFSSPFTPVKQYEDGQYRPYVPQNPNRQA